VDLDRDQHLNGPVPGCTCPACLGPSDDGKGVPATDGPLAAASDTKPPFTLDQAVAILTRDATIWGSPTVTFGFRAVAPPSDYGPESGAFTPFSEEQKAAARAALALWDDVIDITFAEAGPDQAQIVFGNATHDDFQAYALFPGPGKGGDVWVNPNQASNLQFNQGQYGLFTLIHEVGHTLGLNHPGDYDASDDQDSTYAGSAQYRQDSVQFTAMSYFGARNTGGDHGDPRSNPTTPLLHDIAAAQRLYGADLATRAGNTVYGYNSNAGRAAFDFTQNTRPSIAIWDAGGVDTLDLSGSGQLARIDLRQGAHSDVNGLRANVAIAFNAHVENAVGTAFGDQITGNELPNELRGGGGNDIIDGGAGVDTAVYAGARSAYQVTQGAGGVTVRALSGDEGTDTLTGIERLRFADQTQDLEAIPAQPTLSATSLRLVESSEHETVVLFQVTLSQPSAGTVSVAYATRAGTAVALDDFAASSGTLTFAPGEVAKLVPVRVRYDTVAEAEESFSLVLTNLSGAVFTGGDQLRATATIIDDDVGTQDALPAAAQGAAPLAVDTAVTGTLERATQFSTDRDWYAVTLNAGQSYVISLSGRATYAGSLEDPLVRLLDASGTELAMDDDGGPGRNAQIVYTPTATGTYYVEAASYDDPAEQEFDNLTGTYTLLVAKGSAPVVGPTLSVASAPALEGGGTSRAVTFTLTLSAPAADTVRVRVATEGGTAGQGRDFRGVAQEVVFAPGTTTATVAVPILGDAVAEGDEAFTLRIFAPGNAVLENGGSSLAVTGIILNDDAAGAASQPGLVLRQADGNVLSWQPAQGGNGFRPGGTFDPGSIRVAGSGDFDGNGRPDLLLLANDGRTVTFDPSRGAEGFAVLSGLGGASVLAVGNFTGGPTDDLLVRDADGTLRFLDAAADRFQNFIKPAAGFQVVGSGNLDGAGTDDVIFRNDSTGGVLYWNGSGFRDLLTLNGGWRVERAGDFLGDAADDLLLFNTDSRTLIFWNVADGGAGFRDFITLPADWRVLGAGDVNGDGRDDVVLRQEGSGLAIYWNGSQFVDLGNTLAGVELVGIGAAGF